MPNYLEHVSTGGLQHLKISLAKQLPHFLTTVRSTFFKLKIPCLMLSKLTNFLNELQKASLWGYFCSENCSVDALTRQTQLSFLLAFFFLMLDLQRNTLAISVRSPSPLPFTREGKKINTSSVLVFLCLRNTTRTLLTAASRRRGYYKYNPPQNTAR